MPMLDRAKCPRCGIPTIENQTYLSREIRLCDQCFLIEEQEQLEYANNLTRSKSARLDSAARS